MTRRLINFIFVIFLTVFSATVTAFAQQPLDVARSQMHAGRTSDARKIVQAELARGSESARLMEAVLSPRGDSAAALLEKVARESGHGLASAQAAERMGDILFASSRWDDAIKWWEYSLSVTAEQPGRERLAIKSARAEFSAGREKQALARLDPVAQSVSTPIAGEARFWRGKVLERQGKTREAAEEYLAAYTAPGNRLSLAALQRLHNFYGSSGSRNSADWRERWNKASAGTVFDNRFMTSSASAAGVSPGTPSSTGYAIQLGAFSTRQRASDHAARIRRLGLKPVIAPPSSDKLYRVRIEGIPSEKELNRIAALLKKNKFDYQVIRP